jgi:hypothetical protein
MSLTSQKARRLQFVFVATRTFPYIPGKRSVGIEPTRVQTRITG